MGVRERNDLASLYLGVASVNLALSITGLSSSIHLLTGLFLLLVILPHISLAILVPEIFVLEGGFSMAKEARRRILMVSLTLPALLLGALGMLFGIIGMFNHIVISAALFLFILLATKIKSESIIVPPEIKQKIQQLREIELNIFREKNISRNEYFIISIAVFLLFPTIWIGFGENEENSILYIVGEDGRFESLEGEYSVDERIVIIAHISGISDFDSKQIEMSGVLEKFEDENRTNLEQTIDHSTFELNDKEAGSGYAFEIPIEESGFYTFSITVNEVGVDDDLLAVSHKFKVSN